MNKSKIIIEYLYRDAGNYKLYEESVIDNPEVLILSHSVDPENDSISVLKAYAEKHKAINGKWYFCGGN